MQPRALIDEAELARELAGCVVSTTRHAAGSALPRHYHARAYFCFVLDGRFEERAGGAADRCARGALVFHPAGERHADAFAAPTRCLNIELPADLALDAPALGDAFARRDRRTSLRLAAVARRIERELRHPDVGSGLAIRGLVLELAGEWTRAAPRAGRPPAWLAEADRIVRREYRGALAFRDVAARVGVHPVQLSRAYRQAHGVTMTERVTRLRVERAAHLLAHSRQPLAAIALDAGFADQSHLGKVFRRYVGATCGGYRAQHQQLQTTR